MTFACQMCSQPCDESGNVIAVVGDQKPPVTLKTCVPCRLEAIRVKRFGSNRREGHVKRREGYVSLPYKDN